MSPQLLRNLILLPSLLLTPVLTRPSHRAERGVCVPPASRHLEEERRQTRVVVYLMPMNHLCCDFTYSSRDRCFLAYNYDKLSQGWFHNLSSVFIKRWQIGLYRIVQSFIHNVDIQMYINIGMLCSFFSSLVCISLTFISTHRPVLSGALNLFTSLHLLPV